MILICRIMKYLDNVYRVLAGCFIVMSAVSCNVHIWEVREHCPSWLSFDFESSSHVTDSVTLIIRDNGGPVSELEHTYRKPFSPVEYEVERGDVEVTAFSGISKCHRTGTIVMIPEGEQADSLFVHSETVDCSDETAHVDVKLQKQWVTVHLSIVDELQTRGQDEMESLDMEVVSSVSGLEMHSLSDVEGVFRYRPELSSDGTATFRIYRHSEAEEDLHINIYKDDILVDRMSLGAELASSGLDWSAESLDDAEVRIRLVSKQVFIKVIPWTNMGHDNIEF